MAKVTVDEHGWIEEPCLSCDKCYMDDLFHEWHCDEKECTYIKDAHFDDVETKEGREEQLKKLQAEIDYLKFQLRSLSERIENIEKQIKDDKEERLKTLSAARDYANFSVLLSKMNDRK